MSVSTRRWRLVLMLCLTATAGYMCRVNVSTAGALLMDEFGLSQVDMGRVFSAFLLGYAIFQLPSGMLADRWGAKKVLTLSSVLWVALTVLQLVPGWGSFGSSVAFSLPVFLLLRFMVGVSASPAYPAAARGVSSWVDEPFRGTASGIILSSVGLGSALTPLLVTYAMVEGGWRMGMIVSAVPAALMAIGWVWVKDPSPIVFQSKELHTAPIQQIPWSRLILLTVSYSLQSYVGYVFVSWFYIYLVQERHFSLLDGAWASSLPWILSIVSIPLGGWITDRLVLSRMGPVWGLRLVPLVAMIFSGVLISIGAHTGNPIMAAVSLAFATAFILCVEGPFWTTATRVAGARSGTAGGFMNTGGNIGGLLSPLVTPWVASRIGWEGSLHIAAGLAVVGGLLWVAIGASSVQHESGTQ
ncbi:MAG: MFS transporter [Bacteroidetes bacterium]|nr:MFS transporter [Bacteroidota bacterium]